jgi:hypothetical protein
MGPKHLEEYLVYHRCFQKKKIVEQEKSWPILSA